ncbi:unnamed protein product [Rotaria socialis]|uniref:NAD(P)(+)--arginine ADP-ribosyltransferase n=2 Tax=Rotaria socialis TaxID=392032 RepID=A0A821ERI4_9BILA|nr:unnamed protein product [Rotaria socialis]CAF4641549.1 unnamed protein product [Rotaria socialis]
MTFTKKHVDILNKYHQIQPICMQLTKATQPCDHDAIPMSFITEQEISEASANEQNLDRLPPSYMYSVIFKDIILEIDDDDTKSMNTLVNFCQQQKICEKDIDEFKRMYYESSAVWWYTKPMFLYGMLNRALRMLDMEVMTKFGFFIRRLHIELKQLHQEQLADLQKVSTVYRGQGLSQQDVQHLVDTKGGLLSFNNFLSTSKDRDFSIMFAESASSAETDTVGVLFIMSIDQTKISTSITPFAMIDNESAFQSEDEILFTMHTVFRVGEIKQTPENSRLWEVQLTITDESDPQLAGLTDRIKEEIDGRGWYRMGKLMLRVGHFNQAEELYNELLEDASNDSDRAFIYHQLGDVKKNQGKYNEAVSFYENSYSIKRKSLPEDHLGLAIFYNNIGQLYNKMGDYSKALEFYEKTLGLNGKGLPPNHPDLATSYNSIGSVYENMADYSKALLLYEKSLAIRKEVLPPNHPDVGDSYDNIAGLYEVRGEYSKALEYYEKAFKIYQRVLPPNHPRLAASYALIGSVYDNFGDYEKALQFYDKDLHICQLAFHSNHPDLANCYSYLGSVFDRMGQYSKALEYYEKVFRIYQQALPSNHPQMVSYYSNIALTYKNMGQHETSLKHYEIALEIACAILQANHPELATLYNNMGSVYFSMNGFPKALKFYKKALKIRKKVLLRNHPDLAASYNNLGVVHTELNELKSARQYYLKVLKIYEERNVTNHPNLAASYNNLGYVHEKKGEHSKAN